MLCNANFIAYYKKDTSLVPTVINFFLKITFSKKIEVIFVHNF